MQKVVLLLLAAMLLVLACSSSTDKAEKYFEPVPEQYRTIEIPIISEIE